MLGNATLCLSMIVRNEAPVIRRALTSVLPFIDSWCIVDTGSTDDTCAIITDCLGDIPGELLHEPWHDFSTNRNQALLPALRRADYVLILDADEQVQIEPWFLCPELSADSYMIEMRLGGCQYVARRLLKSTLNWAWIGVLHEYPDCAQATTNVRLRGFGITARSEGARSSDPDKFKKDAELLLRAIADEPANDRYRFYLGQTYRDGGQYELAIAAYQDHIALGTGWAEEVWYAQLNIAWCKDKLDQPWPEVQDAYLSAWAQRPDRAEPLYYLAMHALEADQLALADLYLARAYACPIPLHAPLFVDRTLHSVIIPMEYSFCCFKSGRFAEALTIVNRLLALETLPTEARTGLEENQRELLAVLTPQGAAPAAVTQTIQA